MENLKKYGTDSGKSNIFRSSKNTTNSHPRKFRKWHLRYFKL